MEKKGADKSISLFTLDRPIVNKNFVVYELEVNSDNEPVGIHPYWVMLEKDPSGNKVEELTYVESKKLYGVKVLSITKERLSMVVVGLESVIFTVFFSQQQGSWNAGAIINDKRLVVLSVTANLEMRLGIVPVLKTLEITGKGLQGEVVTELLSVNKKIV
jgi:hypothetical protein